MIHAEDQARMRLVERVVAARHICRRFGPGQIILMSGLCRAGKRTMVGRRPMTRVARAIEKGETEGFMEVLVETETKQFLGAAILGVGGDEVIHTVLDLIYAKAPYTVMQRAVHIHPTVSELLPTILGELKPLA